jgi:hypothetical protein
MLRPESKIVPGSGLSRVGSVARTSTLPTTSPLYPRARVLGRDRDQ